VALSNIIIDAGIDGLTFSLRPVLEGFVWMMFR